MFQRTNAVEGHWHVVYIDESTGTGLTSEDSGHRHEVFPMDERMDVQVSAGPDGHVHMVEQMRGPTMNTGTEDDTVRESLALFKAALECEEESRKRACEAEDFYCGDQWPSDVKSKLNELGRAALTINQCEPLVDALCGLQRQQRMDFRVLPVEGGDGKTADILTILLKNVSYDCGLDIEESLVFEDEIIRGRGVFHLVPDFQDDPDGRIMVERFPDEDVYFGPHSRQDLRDCEYVIKARWISAGRAKALWPEREEELETCAMWIDEMSKDPHINNPGQKYQNNPGAVSIPAGLQSEIVDIARKEVRVVEIWRREYYQKPMIIDPAGMAQNQEMSGAEAKRAKSIPGVQVDWQPSTRMRRTVLAGNVLLDDDHPQLPEGITYPVFPVYAKRRNGEWWGKLEAAKDPQREINKRHSQSVDVLNKMSSYGWFIEKGTFGQDQEKQKFLANSSSPGWIVEIADVNRPPRQVEGVKPPSELVQGLQIASEKFREVTGYDQSWATAGGELSGASLVERRRNALIANEFLFDNLAQAKRRLGKAIIAWIQALYSPEKIARMVLSQAGNSQGQAIGGQSIEQFAPEDIMMLLQNQDLNKYDVVVSETGWSPTVRRANFQMWAELAKGGLPVPPQMLVDLSDLPDKDKVLAQFQQQQQQAAAAEQGKQQTEIQKTMIAAQAKQQGGAPQPPMPEQPMPQQPMPPMPPV